MENLFELKRVGYYISKIHNTNPVSTLREINNYEMELYTKVTDNGVSVINGIEYPHKKGNMLFVKPGAKRYSKSGFECYFVHFKCNDENFRKKYLDVLPDSILPHNTSEYINIYKSITDAAISRFSSHELYSNAKLAEMISMLYNLSTKNSGKKSKYGQYEFNVNDAIVIMETRYNEKLTLKEIAEQVNLSPSYFHLVFKDIVGVSPYEYLMNIRINNAKNLIMNSRMSLNEISEEVGFGSQTYLNYVFKRELGVTPNSFRSEKNIII